MSIVHGSFELVWLLEGLPHRVFVGICCAAEAAITGFASSQQKVYMAL